MGNEANLIEKFKELQILKAPVKEGKIVIPAKIQEHPVFRIKDEAFKNKKAIREIDFGKSLKNIGKEAFSGCVNLKEILLPWNVKVIEQNAFANCTQLKKVTIQDGVTHIAERAFARCQSLEKIFIPDTVGMMEDAVFEGCEKAVIACVKDSFAHQYAVKNQISFEIVKPRSDRWMNLLKSKLR